MQFISRRVYSDFALNRGELNGIYKPSTTDVWSLVICLRYMGILMSESSKTNVSILIEIALPSDGVPLDIKTLEEKFNVKSLILDENYEPVVMSNEKGSDSYIVHAWVKNAGGSDAKAEKELYKHADIINVWMDTAIAPFEKGG